MRKYGYRDGSNQGKGLNMAEDQLCHMGHVCRELYNTSYA